MKNSLRLVLVVLVGIMASTGTVFGLSESDTLKSVLKIKVYQEESISGNFIFYAWGSAVAIDKKHIITNAHVVLNSYTGKPEGTYEICRSDKSGKEPICFATARLISYDSVVDLAYLEVSNEIPGVKKITFSNNEADIGSTVVVYGYPDIGGSRITRTEGKIGGTEGDNYKFDGTIDHGNSGGGAFDTSGKLLGIPYAVSSDNGVIGFIIPSSTVQDFLANNTDNIENSTRKIPTEFKEYTKKLQELYKNPDLIKTKNVTIKDLGKAGFALTGAVESNDGSIIDYRFLHKNNRVSIILGCSKNALTSKKTDDEISNDLYQWYRTKNPDWMIKTGTISNGVGIDTITLPEKNGQTTIMFSVFKEKWNNCSVVIIANDKKKDKNVYEKTIELVKKIEIQNAPKSSETFNSKFFKASTIPETLFISEGTSIDHATILPEISTIMGPNFHVNGRLEIYNANSLRDYMDMGYDEDHKYNGTTFSWDDFFARFSAVPVDDADVKDETVISKNGKKLIMTVVYSAEKGSRVLITYPLKNTRGELKNYQIIFDYEGKNTEFENTIRSFFQTVELPGNSPFKNGITLNSAPEKSQGDVNIGTK